MNHQASEGASKWKSARLAFQAILLGGVTAVAFLTLELSSISAQDSSRLSASGRAPVPFEKQARTTAISDKKVKLQLTFPNGVVFDVTQFEGATIRIEQDGSTVGLAPYIIEDRVTVRTFRIFSVEDQGVTLAEGMSDVALIDVGPKTPGASRSQIGLSEVTNGALNFSVGVTKVMSPRGGVERNPQNPRQLSGSLPGGARVVKTLASAVLETQDYNPGGESGGGICCVTCSGVQVCGCCVRGPCGACCVGVCCNDC
jgi:hypothetical protein